MSQLIKNLLFFSLAFILFSCKREIQLTEVITTGPAFVGDTLTTVAILSEQSDKAEFGWNFLSPGGTVITPFEHWDNVAHWIPPMPGMYKVGAVAERGKEVSVLTTSVFIQGNDSSSHKDAIVGTWIGTCNTPWVPDYQVQFEFFDNGHYIGTHLTGDQTATYYGDDGDYPLNTYEITPTQQDVAIGMIDIYFAISTSVMTDELEGIHFYNNYNGLKFYFYHNGTYGPLEYDLTRQ